MTSLENIQLDYNKIKSIPVEIIDLKTLTHISLGHNKLTHIPMEIIELTSLTYMFIAENKIENLNQMKWLMPDCTFEDVDLPF